MDMQSPLAVVLAMLLTLMPLVGAGAGRELQRSVVLMWWNIENLFDTRDNPNTDDDEFTPQGRLHWTEKKLLLKQVRIGAVLKAVSIDRRFGGYPDILAFAESENRQVFAGTLASAGVGSWQIAYHESPDPRGIDIGLAWNPRTVAFRGSKAYRVPLPDGRRTREVIVAGFSTSGRPFTLVLNHWPSRSFDTAWTEQNRLVAASVARHIVDSLRCHDTRAAIVVMGDFNDQPENRSLREVLGSSFDRNAVRSRDNCLLYNLWNEMPTGGSYLFKGHWERIDQVLVSAPLLDPHGLHFEPKSFMPFRLRDMVEDSGMRLYSTYESGRYRGGYSDHLPLLLKLNISD